ncbi:HAD family hydrolase [Candidatus Pacearchaeota archaeon]|nr:HAD family hydrolase [Candidatus Pacearchaeota archaeon]
MKSCRESHSNNFKLIMLDFDGTIVDTKKLYYSSILRELKKAGHHSGQAEKRLIANLGMRLPELLKRIGVKNKKKVEIIKGKINNYVIKNSENIKRCSHVDAIKNLKKDFHVVVISNSVRSFIRKIARRLRIESYFSRIIGGESFVDKAKMFKSLFMEYRIKPHDAVYVGDRAYDAIVARKAGCKSIIIANTCSWNSLPDIMKAKPDYVAGSLKGLKKVLARQGR